MENNNQKMIDGLKQLAEFLEEHPDFTEMGFVFTYLWAADKSEFSKIVRALGTGVKATDEKYLNFDRWFGPIKVQATINHEKICEKIVEFEEIPAIEIPEKHAEPARFIPATTREVVKWKCPESIMALGE